MLIAKAHKKIILNVRNSGRITTIIPSAKKISYKGNDLVVVPHKDEESRVLRNLGFSIPAPISHYYEWQGKHQPYIHQKETASFFTMYPRCFCLNGMGSGKTMSTLWAFDYLRRIGVVTRLLVLAPLSTLERTWIDEVFNSFPDLTYCVLHGTEEKREKLLKNDFDVYVINHDGIKNKRILQMLIDRTDIDLIVIDEVASFRKANTERWKAAHKLVKSRSWVWGLTGTPTPKEPTDAWAQVRLINPSAVPNAFTTFRDMTMRQAGPYKWIARDNASQTVSDAMQPAIRFSREDCIDLPPTTYLTRHAAMTDEQTRLYKSMMTQMAAEYEDGKVSAVNAAVKSNKLLQIASGSVYSEDGGTMYLPCQPRLDVLLELVEGSASKVIVFVPFTGALDAVTEFLRGEGFSVENIHGGVSKGERDRIFSAFQKQKDPHVIVANPAAMSHGLTLTAASTIIWFAPTMNNETYEQANMRIVRPGQTLNTLIAHIEGSLVERKAYERLQHRGKMQGFLLDLMKEGVSTSSLV